MTGAQACQTRARIAMRFGAGLCALRIGNGIVLHEYANVPGHPAAPPVRKRNAWSYIVARDMLVKNAHP
jgi:hypothetical protein